MFRKRKRGIRLPILMYHSAEKNPNGPYTITPELLDSDFDYLSKNGYTPVFVSDVINYVLNDVPLPVKPIVITFDDGYLDNLTYAFPLLKKYNFKAVISIVGRSSELYSESSDVPHMAPHLTWKDISFLANSGNIEIANHTYYLHNSLFRHGCERLPDEDFDKYENTLTLDIMKTQNLLDANSGVAPVTFTYPYGISSAESESVMKKLGFKATLVINEKINTITKNPDCLYSLNRVTRFGGMPTELFMRKMETEPPQKP